MEASLPDSTVEVIENGGYFSLRVTASVFQGKKNMEMQWMVYSALSELMSGMNTPVQAFEILKKLVPEN